MNSMTNKTKKLVELIEGFINGEPKASELLYKAIWEIALMQLSNGGKNFGFSSRLPSYEVEDDISEKVIKLLQSDLTPLLGKNPLAFFKTVFSNLFRDKIRAKKNQKLFNESDFRSSDSSENESDVPHFMRNAAADESFSADFAMNQRELTLMVQKMLSNLNANQQQVIYMVFFEGKKNKQIATELSLTENQVAGLKFYALQNLNKYLPKNN